MNKIYTVERQLKDWSQAWIEEYSSRAKAIEMACREWESLTIDEQKKNIVMVYEDEILENDERLSWNDGYDPIITLSYMTEKDLANKLWQIYCDYVAWWDREDASEEDFRENLYERLSAFMDSVKKDTDEDPENTDATETLEQLNALWAMYR